MTEQEIIESNKLIAEFMEYQILHKKFQYQDFNSSNESYFAWDEGNIVCDKDGHELMLYPDSDPLTELFEIPFNSDWNLLMSTWKKLQQKVAGYGKSWHIEMHRLPECRKFIEIGLTCADINVAFEELVKLIKWYNENKNEKA